MKLLTSVAALGVAGSVLAVGPLGLAGAAATQKGGAIRVFVTNTSETKGKITITGAVGDYGTTISEDKNGKVDANGDYEKVVLSQGTFVVDGTQLNQKLAHDRPEVNTSNCSIAFVGTGPTTIGSGTGAYAGISGTVAITISFAGIVPHKGSGCDTQASDAETHGEYSSITGVGRVSFS